MDGLYGLLMVLFSSYQASDFVINRCSKQYEEVTVLDVEELIVKSTTAKKLIGYDYKNFQGGCMVESIAMESLIDFVWNFEKYTQWEDTVIKVEMLPSTDSNKQEARLYYKYTMKNKKIVFVDSQLLFEKKIVSDTEVHIAWRLSQQDSKKSFDIHEGVWYFIKSGINEILIFHFTRVDLHGPIRSIFNGKATKKAALKTLTALHKRIGENRNLEQAGIKNEATETHLTKNN
jgi:hypothetical protein